MAVATNLPSNHLCPHRYLQRQSTNFFSAYCLTCSMRIDISLYLQRAHTAVLYAGVCADGGIQVRELSHKIFTEFEHLFKTAK